MKITNPFIVTILFASCFGKKLELTGNEGKMLPSFQILLPDSTTWLKTEDIKAGKPSVFFLFGPYCSYSKAEMQDIIDNAKELRGLQFYIITPYPFNQMKEFYNSYKLKDHSNITTGVDPVNFFGNYMRATGVPFIALYDKDKKMKKAFKGKTDVNHIKEAVED